MGTAQQINNPILKKNQQTTYFEFFSPKKLIKKKLPCFSQ